MTRGIDRLSCYNTQFVERRLDEYLRDPNSVSRSWRRWFGELNKGGSLAPLSRSSLDRRSVFNPVGNNGASARQHSDSVRLQARVDQLIRAHRVRGHLAAKLDPLDMPRPQPPELLPETYGFEEADLDRQCSPLSAVSDHTETLREIVERLRDTYCRHIGVQFMHIDNWASSTVSAWITRKRWSLGKLSTATSPTPLK